MYVDHNTYRPNLGGRVEGGKGYRISCSLKFFLGTYIKLYGIAEMRLLEMYNFKLNVGFSYLIENSTI